MTAAGFDLNLLDISVVGEGFIVGVSTAGSVVGEESAYRLDVTDQLTALDINLPRRVDDDLFIFAETRTLTMSAIFEDAPQVLKGKVVLVQYNGQDVLFRGRVLSSTRSVAVDLKRPGNRKWSVSLTATAGEERSVRYRITAPSATEAGPEAAILERLPYVATVYVHPDLDLTDVLVAAGHEASMTGTELLTRISRICSCYVQVDQDQASRLMLLPYDYGSTWTLRDDDWPSYRSVQFTEALDAATSVTVTPMFKPASAPEEENLSVTRTLPGALRNDVSVTVDVPWDLTLLEDAAARMPIKRTQPEYVKSVDLPFDGRLDMSDQPTRLTLWLDGRRWDAAVVGVKHSIQARPAKWDVSLDCAPVHLLTRVSDAA